MIVKTKLLFFETITLFPDEEFPQLMAFSVHRRQEYTLGILLI